MKNRNPLKTITHPLSWLSVLFAIYSFRPFVAKSMMTGVSSHVQPVQKPLTVAEQGYKTEIGGEVEIEDNAELEAKDIGERLRYSIEIAVCPSTWHPPAKKWQAPIAHTETPC